MNPQPNTLETLLDGREVEVVHVAKPGESPLRELVRVRKVPLRQMQRLAEVWCQPEKEVPFYVGRDAAWLETITDESFERVMDTGRELNLPFFEKWLHWQRQAVVVISRPKEPTSSK